MDMKLGMRFIITLCIVIGFTTCKKEVVTPPVTNMLGHKVYSVTELKAIATCTNQCVHRFSTDVYFIGVVIADEQSGNFYKEIYVRDRYNTGGIHLDFTTRSNFYIGDSVRVNLKGCDVNINTTTDMLEIDSLDHEKYIVKFATGPKPQPRQISLSQISSSNPYSNYLCDLIQVNNVGFLPVDTAQIWADPISQTSLSRTIKDCDGYQLLVRTSNYANFAQQKTPKGAGSIIGIATSYKGINQMAIRNPNELNMNGTGCTVYHKKDFEDGSVLTGSWSIQSVSNTAVTWVASSFSTDKFAKISGYISGNQISECWYISPALNLSSASNPILSFRTAAKFSGNVLEVLVSTDYVSGAPSTGSWASLNGFALSPNNPGSYAWTPSGNISLNAYKNANTRIAFKYKSSTSGATTYELDDVLVREN